ncbi:MAG: NTP transferase domain-containing protein [Barnesiella sp.]|nr:NTP transferase domain-containing protein [Barnesiella sp.]
MTRHIITDDSTLLDALGRLNALSGGVMTLLVTDKEGVMTGTLTDGDIRRGLLAGALPTTKVREIMHRSFKALTGQSDDISRLREFRRRGLTLVPRLGSDGRIIEIIDTTVTRSLLPLSAIIMAGGKGERLRPLTLSTPKPLLEIGGKPIIDYNIDLLRSNGITDITVTVNYLAEAIEAHFADTDIKCVRESSPLGTIGAAALVPHKPDGTTIVMNSDLLTTISLEDMYLRHISEEADITVAAIPYNLSVPYAILTTEGARVTGLEEKPSYSYYANAGIYMISNRLLSELPSDRRTDATDLIAEAIADGYKVVYFPISGTWIDIGSHVDFRHACELMLHHETMRR